MDEIRGAVIGFGKLGLLHAGLLNGLPGTRLSAVVESSPLIQRVIRQHFPTVEVFSDVSELMSGELPTCAVIATPTGSHVQIAAALLEAHVPVLIEKPLSIKASDAAPLAAALGRRWVPNMVGYMGRYLDTFRKARELIQDGVLGAVRMVRSSMYVEQLMKRGEGWRYDPRVSGGGVLITQNSHLVDKLCWMFGDVRGVSGHTTRFVSAEVEDHVHAYFEFTSGAVGYLDASWSARHYRTPTISIHAQGDNGKLDVDDDEVRVCLDSPAADLVSGWHRWRKPDLYRAVPLDIGGPQYSLQMMDFLQAVRSLSGVESDIASGIRTQRVIDAIYASARAGGVPHSLETLSR